MECPGTHVESPSTLITANIVRNDEEFYNEILALSKKLPIFQPLSKSKPTYCTQLETKVDNEK